MKAAFSFTSAIALLLAFSTSAVAQDGIALKGHYVYNSDMVDELGDSHAIEGVGVGVEYVLPFGIGVGVSGFTVGDGFSNLDQRTFSVLAEANYFFDLPLLPLTSYAGVHTGLGTYRWNDTDDASPEVQDRSGSELGYQIGLRFQPFDLIGIDAQYRRVSESILSEQDPRFDRTQFLVGITLF